MESKDIVDSEKKVENKVEESSLDWIDEPEDISKQTPIHNKYAFWFHKRGGQGGNKFANYEENILKIDVSQTVSDTKATHNLILFL